MFVTTVDSKDAKLTVIQDDIAAMSFKQETVVPMEEESKEKSTDVAMEEEPEKTCPVTDMVDISMVQSNGEEKVPSALNVFRNPDQHTVVIFDWDDTLLASSHLHQRGYRLDTTMPPNEEIDNGLKELEKSVVTLLSMAVEYGEVNIVTNAETGWVQMSAAKFMPAVLPLLDKVHVISARSTFEAAHPDAPLQWKYHAMHRRLSDHFPAVDSPPDRHIISFGDSHVEREAVRTVAKNFNNVRTKSVKFAERPSMEQLRRQIELVTNCFQYLYTFNGDLDLMLTISLMY